MLTNNQFCTQDNILGDYSHPYDSNIIVKTSKNKSSSQNLQYQKINSSLLYIPRLNFTELTFKFIKSELKTIPTHRQIKIEDFYVRQRLGSGNYGQVLLVRHIETGFICAMKAIDKKIIKSKSRNLDLLILELKIQSFLQYPNIIQLYGFFQNEKTFFILLQLASHGNLCKIMQKKANKKQLLQETTHSFTTTKLKNSKICSPLFHEQTISLIIRDLLNCCIYMQSKNIIHRDLKPQNIVVTHGTVKLCDFGLAAYCSPKKSGKYRSTICGTLLYLSPEIILGRRYGFKVDIWALGILAYQLFTGTDPFKVIQNKDLFRILFERLEIQDGSIQFSLFLSHILQKNPNYRFDGKELRQHEFIKKYKQLQTAEQLCEASE